MEKRFCYFLAGLTAGIAVTLLMAPKSGRDTRRLIVKKVGQGKEFVARGSATVIDSASDFYERGKDTVSRTGDAVASAVSAGKRAFASKF